MSSLPANIYSVATVREIDRTAIEDHGIDGYALMTRAAAFAVSKAVRSYPEARHWQVLCGAGNNAGDGYVVARLAAAMGLEVSALAVTDPAELQGDAATAHTDYLVAGGQISAWNGNLENDATLLIDAVLGSGLTRDVDGDFAAAVAAMNAADAPVVALDIPTGLHGDTGTVMGIAVRAELTTTFVGLKQGLFLGSGPECRGDLYFSDLEIDAECYAGKPVELERITDEQLAGLLPRRSRTAHKGNFGHVHIVGGGQGMPGAAILSGEAALRSGAGRVSVATFPEHVTSLVNERPELMATGVRDATDLAESLKSSEVVVAGPGLGRTRWADDLMSGLQGYAGRSVWDADALNWLAEHPAANERRIITPHPGEAATLLGTQTQAIQNDRRAAVIALQARYGGVAVLKGAGTLIKGVEHAILVSSSGNPGMASPGMGDVLAGIIGSLLGQGLRLRDAAAAGVELHAQVGDIAARKGERGMLATDLLNELRSVVNR